MNTTQAPLRVTITAIDRDGFDFDEDQDGLGIATVGFTAGQFDGLSDEDRNRAEIQWEKDVANLPSRRFCPRARWQSVATST